MQAISCDRLGGPEVLRLVNIPRTTPGKDEVLVRARASSINVIDGRVRSGRIGVSLGGRVPRSPGAAQGAVAAHADRLTLL